MDMVNIICGTDTANHERDPYIREAKKRFFMKVSVVCAKAVATACLEWKNRSVLAVQDGAGTYPYPYEDYDPRDVVPPPVPRVPRAQRDPAPQANEAARPSTVPRSGARAGRARREPTAQVPQAAPSSPRNASNHAPRRPRRQG